MGYGALPVLRRMDKEQKRRGGTVQNRESNEFTIFPTCPPSTSIHFRGGLAWYLATDVWPTGFFIPSYTVDLTDPDKTSVRPNYFSYTYTFTNARWYAPCLIVISQYPVWPPPEPPDTWPDEVPDHIIELDGDTGYPYMEEYETAAEAEEALIDIRKDYSTYTGIPAAGLILRNNGNTSGTNQYEPIDKINRGRSYLFGKNRIIGWQVG